MTVKICLNNNCDLYYFKNRNNKHLWSLDHIRCPNCKLILQKYSGHSPQSKNLKEKKC